MNYGTDYERFDSFYGTVTGHSRAGIYVSIDGLEMKEDAFSYTVSNLPNGTRVLCSLQKDADPSTGKRMLVSIDSVLWNWIPVPKIA